MSRCPHVRDVPRSKAIASLLLVQPTASFDIVNAARRRDW